MIATPFRLVRATSIEEACEALANAAPGEAAVLGGGTLLVPDLVGGRVKPAVVVDLALAGLRFVHTTGEGLIIGAGATYADLERPALDDAAARVLARLAWGITGGAQVRNRATAAGSAAFANPASDIPPALVALGARVRLVSGSGRREVPAEGFFAGAFATQRRPDELIEALVVPTLGPGARAGHHKLKFGESSWPIVTATVVEREGAGVRAVLAGVAPAPVVVEAPTLTDALDELRSRAWEPWSDELAGAGYRREVAPAIARRAYEAASA